VDGSFLSRHEPSRSAEERQLGLALTAQHREVDLHAADRTGLRERERLRAEPLRRERGVAALARARERFGEDGYYERLMASYRTALA